MFNILQMAVLALSAGFIGPAAPPEDNAGGDSARQPKPDTWSIEAAHGPTIPFEVTLDEATWMSVDVSPDGGTLVFDILGDLYILPIEGGDARRITSGPAYDAQPRFSPDGRRIAFVSDRDGSSNVWQVAPDGANPEPLTNDKDATFSSPQWTPDGDYILVSRHDDLTVSDAFDLYMFHIGGGKGIKLIGQDRSPLGAAPSPDGRWIYFSAQSRAGATIERFDRETGIIHPLIGGYGGAVRPAVSPDGIWLAFGRRSDAGERMVLRNLKTGAERVLDVALDDRLDHPLTDVDKLPGYAFTPDHSAIIYSAHGKLRRYDLQSGASTVIPFRAHFEQPIHKPLAADYEIDNGPVKPKLLRWTHESPGGEALYFSAAGKNYRYDVASTSVRPVGAGPGLQYSPAISPDGRWLAYVTWSDSEGGHIYKTLVDRDRPVRLTEEPGLYEHLSWSADSSKLVFLQSSGGELRGEGNLEENFTKRVRWLHADRGAPVQTVATVPPRGDRRQEMRPSFDHSGERIYFSETPVRREATYLSSAPLDGSDRRRHLRFGFAEDMVPSPDGKWVAFTEHFEVYLVPLPAAGREPVDVRVTGGALPTFKLSDEGGYFINWSQDGQALTWSWGAEFYRLPLRDAHRQDRDAKPTKTTIEFAEPRAIASGQVVLQGARIITMGEGGVIERGDILIENDRIKAVAKTGEIELPAGAPVLDMSGQTVIPGLIDIHMHYRASFDTEVFPQNDWGYVAHLAYGVTTVRNPSARGQAIFTQAEMIEMGRGLGPRVFSTGDILYFVETPFARPIRDLEDARVQVRRLKKLGATSIKQYRQPRREQRQWILQAAREEGLAAVGEGAWKTFHNLTVIMDGHTTLEHAFKTARLYQDIRKLLVASGVYYTPTLFVTQNGSAEDYFYQQSEVFRDRKLLRFMPYEILASKARHRMMRPEEDFFFKRLAESSAQVLREGGNVAFGAHGNLLGLGAHWELWALAMGGLSPLEALSTATNVAAAALGLANDIGSIEPGKVADLVILDENPLDDIRNSNTVRYVMKNGLLWQGDTMDQVWPEQKKFEGFYWQQDNGSAY